ncbi:hypothetical protein Pve01_81280 [Planomonospora venezuelensis]|nr:hypothetical protein Pve01_81280 [Planomonospora venezuelensis]
MSDDLDRPGRADEVADPGGLAAFVGGDAEGVRSLRRALEALRTTDLPASLDGQIGAVLGGRLSMRELAQEPAMRDVAERGLARLRDELGEMSPEDRADLVRRSTARAAHDAQRDSDRELADP